MVHFWQIYLKNQRGIFCYMLQVCAQGRTAHNPPWNIFCSNGIEAVVQLGFGKLQCHENAENVRPTCVAVITDGAWFTVQCQHWLQIACDQCFLLIRHFMTLCRTQSIQYNRTLHIYMCRPKPHKDDLTCARWSELKLGSTNTGWQTDTRLTAFFPEQPGYAGTRKVKPIWILCIGGFYQRQGQASWIFQEQHIQHCWGVRKDHPECLLCWKPSGSWDSAPRPCWGRLQCSPDFLAHCPLFSHNPIPLFSCPLDLTSEQLASPNPFIKIRLIWSKR